MSTALRTRRNGQPQACEPCRKAKVRCDHQDPQCSRCHARRLVCVYQTAPMTRVRNSASPLPQRETAPYHPVLDVLRSPPPPAVQHSTAPNIPEAGVFNAEENSPSAAAGAAPGSLGARRISLFHKEGASYGPTRFSAVFSENQNSFGPAIRGVIDPEMSPVVDSPNHVTNPATEPLKELAIETLLSFPTLRTFEALIQDIHFIHDIWISPTMIRSCLDQLWTQYGEHLGDDRSRESVWAVAKDLHENGKHPVPSVELEGDSAWVNWFGGTSLRWEMIGILFSWAGMAFKHKQEWDPVFGLPEQRQRNRRTAADRMRECSVACLQFSHASAEISDIIVCLMKNTVKLQSIIFSDESDQLRVDFGTVGSAFITAGLHRLPPADHVTPLSQYRSTLSASMYNLDKNESLFNGRPPMLDRRYCHCPLPLDLSEEDVYSGPERLANAVSKLSPDGWNTDGKIYTVTWLRASCMLSPIKEDILRLSLSYGRQFTKVQVSELIGNLKGVVRSFPPQIQYEYKARWPQEPGFAANPSSAHDLFIVARIHLDVLQCHFLMQRLLVSQAYSDGQELFDIAQETISVILSIWSNRDHLQNFYYTFDWIIVAFGIPAAGILCVELLRANTPASTSTTDTAPPARVILSRSEVVQSLVMFIAFLDWTRPTDNNAQLCGKFSKVIKRIIDATFDSPSTSHIRQHQNDRPAPQIQREEHTQQIIQTATPNLTDFVHEIDPSWLSTEDLAWLNSVDWTQGDWLDPT